MRILMVEDEQHLAEAVAQVLKKNHYSVDLAYDGEYGLDCALSDIYDIIVLDIMLPKRDGLSVMRELRKQGISTPVLLLTARGDTRDKVLGLDSGADDYLPKPFHTDELLARLRALGRRKGELRVDDRMQAADMCFSPHTLTLAGPHKEVKLTAKESQLLELLYLNKGRIISKEQIIEKLWGYDTDAEDSHVEIHVSLLRKKLRQSGCHVSIQTIRGAGYYLQLP